MKCFVALIVAALAIGANAQTGPCANIRTRAAWGSRTTSTSALPTQPPNAFGEIKDKLIRLVYP